MAAAANSKTQVDLIDCIEWPSLECLNANPKHGIVNAIKQGYREDDGLHLESDVDEQLLVYVPFNQVVKLHSMVIKGPSDSGPKTVRLYANRPSMGFSNVNDFPASDTLTLTPEQLKGEQPVPLKYVKFQNVRSLTVFFENNQDDTDTTTVQKIGILGSTVETTNMKELKKVDKE